MRIGLIDVDGHNFPNIALMKISAYHKAINDTVEWYSPFEDYDTVYLSKVFSFSEDYRLPINARKAIIYGGTGYQINNINGVEYFTNNPGIPFLSPHEPKVLFYAKLPAWIENRFPDYSIYPIYTKDTAYGFLTRGCPRGCAFCHVGTKEGKSSYKVADLSEFWKGQKNIVLCDPNILACRDWKPLLQQLIDSKAWVDFNQGLDIRMMTEEKAEMLSKIKTKEIHFAWDRYQDKDIILPKLKLFSEIKYKSKNPDHSAMVYVLVNFDTTIEQDLERIYTLREMGYWAYIMIYDKEHADMEHKYLARWCNNRRIFAKCPRFEDYNRKR